MGKWDNVGQIWDILDQLDREEKERKLKFKIKRFLRRILKCS